ncbi:alpha/beta hydrolase [Companilactobacillus mishanensis]|uniref:alpha/beta hydrolase n=1 Tax=Companilactobacillus mishanensis TaxID=2486008 RepID=UPI001296F7D9|nr:alpha/beta hydrolase [Companilactobacillus mishanensis]MQS88205.1 alpha/beta hydrolase [Companilactobacillus mishanensis]
MKRITKWIISILIAIIILIGITFGIVKSKEYQPSPSAINDAKTSTMVGSTTEFKGNTTKPRIIFYPGALVEPKSYSIWAKQVSNAGYSVYIVRFPLDMAVLNANAARKIQNNKDYIIGGHSLGGTMAARYAHNNTKHLKGIFFLASYPEKKGNLRHTSAPVISITGTKDGVLDQKNYKTSKKYLPKTTDFEEIKGGNHAGFGSYGKQKGDNKAIISNKEQQNKVAQLLINWLNNKVK